jgi:transposase
MSKRGDVYLRKLFVHGARANKNARIVWALLAHNQEYRVRAVV